VHTQEIQGKHVDYAEMCTNIGKESVTIKTCAEWCIA